MESNFLKFLLTASELKTIKGGATTYSCEMHFHSGGIEYTKSADVTTTSLSAAEKYNTFGPVNGTSIYTCCKVKGDF